MRDVDDGRAAARDAANGAEQELDRVLGERRGRLVQDQEPRVDGEGLGELEKVALRDAERRHAVLEMTREMHVVEQ